MPKIYPIGGGKGGSGKSFLNANLGVLFAKSNKKVVLVDLDLGGSNLHTLLGVKNPKPGLHDFLQKRFKKLDETAVETCIPNLFLISSINCSMEIANLFHAQKMKIIRAIKNLPFDYILLDLGAGTNFNTLDFFLSSNEGVFTVTPEPTSIENMFRFIKAAYYRKIKQILQKEEFKYVTGEVQAGLKHGEALSPSQMVEYLIKRYPQKGKLLKHRLAKSEFKFVINQFRKQTDVDLGEKIEKVCNKHFFSRFVFLGNVSYDEKVHDSISMKEMYIQKYPYTITAIDLQNIIMKIGGKENNSSVLSWKN